MPPAPGILRIDFLAVDEDPRFPVGLDIARDESAQRVAQRWHEERKTDDVGKKSRGQQQRTGEQQAEAVEQLLGGQHVPVNLRARPGQSGRALNTQQRASGDRRQHHDRQGRPEADCAADFDEQRDFDERHADKGGQEHETHACPSLAMILCRE